MATLQITRDQFMDAVEAGIREGTESRVTSEYRLTGGTIAKLRALAISAREASVGSYSRGCGCPITQIGGYDFAQDRCTLPGCGLFASGFDQFIDDLARTDRGIDIPDEDIEKVVVR